MKSRITNTPAQWWGQFELDVGQSGRWEIASLAIAVTRLEHEWRIQHREKELEETSSSGWSVSVPGEALGEDTAVARYVFRNSPGYVVIRPSLADRPIVTRPVDPIHLQGDEEVTIFVSSPLWVNVCRQGVEKPLLDIPVQRPSDTWFGPSTMQGEICYAARTHARLSRDEAPPQQHRALTAVSVRNEGGRPLLLERLKLPVCQLALYTTDSVGQSFLWTSNLRIVAEKGMALAEMHVEEEPPQYVTGADLVSRPREPLENHVFQRAVHALLG